MDTGDRLRQSKLRLFSTLGILAVGTCGLAACGGSSGGTSHASNSSAETTACVAWAKQAQQKSEQPAGLNLQPLPKPVSQLDHSGKVFVVGDTEVGVYTQVADGITAGMKAVGLGTEVYNDSGQSANDVPAINRAVAQGATAVAILGIKPSTVDPALTQAAAKGVPVVSVFEPPDSAASKKSVKWVTLISGEGQADELFSYAAAQSGCHVMGGDSYVATLTTPVDVVHTVQALMMKHCPSTCKLYTSTYDFATQATAEPASIISLVRNHPGVKYLFSSDPSVPLYLGTLKTAGVKTPILAPGGTPIMDQQMKEQSSQIAAEVAQESFTYEGWLAADAILRAMGGGTGTTNGPNVLVTHQSTTDPFAKLAGYPQKFVAAWKG